LEFLKYTVFSSDNQKLIIQQEEGEKTSKKIKVSKECYKPIICSNKLSIDEYILLRT